MKKLFIIFFLFSFTHAYAATIAEVLILKGEVTFADKKLSKGDIIEKKGLIKVGDKSYIKLNLIEQDSEISLSANTELLISRKKFKKKKKVNTIYTLQNGFVRWITKEGAKKKSRYLRTKTTIIGIRGTDFLLTENSLLKETEVYCFDGEVLCVNRKDKKDRGVLKKNDWCGVGGRFGEGVGDVVPMTEEQITYVKKLLK